MKSWGLSGGILGSTLGWLWERGPIEGRMIMILTIMVLIMTIMIIIILIIII